jgi:hypothetical protein
MVSYLIIGILIYFFLRWISPPKQKYMFNNWWNIVVIIFGWFLFVCHLIWTFMTLICESLDEDKKNGRLK